MQYDCATCGQRHEGTPSLGAEAPLYYYSIPGSECATRCRLDADTCVIDDAFFFVRGCVEIPIHGQREPFVWGLWVSLSGSNFAKFVELLDVPERSAEGPFFGWLSARIRGYQDTENLKACVHLRNDGVRPFIELEPTDHPLAVEQRAGISRDRVAEILSLHLHGESAVQDGTESRS